MKKFKQWLESIYDGSTIQDKGLLELFRNIKSGDHSAINQFYLRRRENPYFCPQKFARFGQTSLG
jgi:hypothetical protein